jgi:sulfatase maturation enzyme AslB (radical SAM superfamily)
MNNYLSIEHIKYSLSNLHLLTFEVTDACNLKCKYCGYGEFYASLILNRKFFQKKFGSFKKIL